MADRYLRGFVRTNQPVVSRLYLRFDVGNTGAITANTTAGDTSFITVARTSAGKYTFTFADAWVALLDFNSAILNASVTGLTCEIVSQAITSAGGTVVVQFVGPTNSSTTTPVATEVPSGSTLRFAFDLLNSGA